MKITALTRRLAAVTIAVGACFALLSHGITREVPVGGVSGTVRMKENGKLLPNANVTLRADIDYDAYYAGKLKLDHEPEVYVGTTDGEGRFLLTGVRAQKYVMQVSGDVHQIQDVEVEVIEGKPVAVDVEVAPTDPYLEVYASQHVFTPGQAIEFNLHGFSQTTESQIRIYELPFTEVVEKQGLSTLLQSFRNRYNDKGLQPAKVGKLVSKTTQPNRGRDVEGVFRMPVKLGELSEALYWVECETEGMNRGTWFVVSKIGLITKQGKGENLCYVADLAAGTPISGATIYGSESSKAVAKGKTGADGTFRYTINRNDQRTREIAIAQYGKSWAVADSYLRENTDEGQVTTFMYAERPVYRPGDTVQFKGISRKLAGKNYLVFANQPVEVEVRDESDNLLQKFATQTNDMGSFSGRFTTNREMAPGNYYVHANVNGHSQELPVTLAAYRKPSYQITVTPEKKRYILGDKVRFIVKVEYYFGGPVVGAKVDSYVSRESLWSYSDDEQDDEEYEYGSGGEYFNDFEAVTDDNGEAIIEFDSRESSEDLKPAPDTDFIYTLNATVEDAGGKYFEGDGSVKVARGEFDLRVESDRYVAEKGQPLTYKITAVDSMTGEPMANQEIELKYGLEYWNGKSSQMRMQENLKATTDSSGVATVQLTPRTAGDYQLIAQARDRQGNVVQRSNYVWVSARDFDYSEVMPEKNLSLKLDKKLYKPGEKALAVIRPSKVGGYAWLTIEADELYSSRIIHLDKPVVTVEIPVTGAYTPNVYVSVCMIQDKKFWSRTRTLAVELGAKKLDIEVKSDKEVYLPGEKASYTVTTKTEDGKPVPADVSLGVVDESIYAIAPDNTNIASAFYARRYNEVDTSYSFPEVYLDGGDKAPSSIKVRRRFEDTAFWGPNVRTDASGQARVSFQLPDNITSWRATAVGITANTEVGQITQNVLARRPLMVRLEGPAFLVQSDQQRLIAAVTNYSGQDADVNVEITVEGAQLDGSLRRKERVKNGETSAFEWTVNVPSSGEAKFVAKAWIDSTVNDGVELRIPVKSHAREYVDYSAGLLKTNASMSFVMRDGFDPKLGGLDISVSPSLGTTVYQAIDYLVDFPYGCVEQTLGRFVPCLAASQISASKGQQRPARFAKVDQWISEGISRLSAMQHYNGSWGWWEYDDDNVFMTAMVLEALSVAKKSGYLRADSRMLERSLEWASQRMKSEMPELEKNKFGTITNQWEFDEELRNRIYLCYALALHGRSVPVANFLQKYPVGKMNAVSAANIALAYHAMGPAYTALRDQALQRMLSLGAETPSILTFKEDYWGRETTGKALLALSTIRPDDPRLTKIVVGLMLARRGNIWGSTRDTNFILMGMMNVWQRQKEVAPNLQVAVRVNGQNVGSLTLNQNYWETPLTSIKVPASALRVGENRVELVGAGAGQCYYTASLRQSVYQKEIGSLTTDKGFSVTRNYYRVVPQKMEDGSYQLVPDKNPIDTINRGDLIYCVVKVKTDTFREYVIVEDPLPSSCIVTERDSVEDPEEWSTWAWYSKLVIRDDKVAFFARYMDAGEHTFSYTIRAENPGVASVLPTVTYNMYDTDKRASSAENRLEVRR